MTGLSSRFRRTPAVRAALRWAMRLTEPHPTVPTVARSTARAFSGFALLLFTVLIGIIPAWLGFSEYPVLTVLMALFSTMGLAGAYLVSRTPYYRHGLRGVIIMIAIVVTVSVISESRTPPILYSTTNILKYFMLCVLMAGFVLNARETLLTGIVLTITVALLTGMILRQPSEVVMLETLFAGLTSSLIILGTTVRERYVRQEAISQERYRALFEQSSDPIMVLTLNGVILESNASAAAMLGRSADELRSTVYTDMIVPDEVEEVMRIRERLKHGENVPPYERTFRRPDGSLFIVEMQSTIIQLPDDNPPQLQLVMRDLTARKRAERAAIEAAVERERGQILTAFIRGASHEFRTPLAIIGTNNHLLRRDQTEDMRTRRLDTVQSQVDRLNRLLSMMMMMVRVDSGEPLQFAPVQIGDLLRDLHYHFTARAGGKVTVTVDAAPDLPKVQAEQFFLSEALRHLFNNAVQYTSQGGAVSVKAWHERGTVYIAFADTGIGINDEQRARIFERFYRADEAYNVEGFGLGLSIARAIVERHGGAITVVSAPGAGSTFTVALPVHAPAAAFAPADSPNAHPRPLT